MEGPVECRGRRVLFRSEVQTLPNGYTMRVDKCIFPDAVAVLPVVEGRTAVLIRQYRPVLGRYILEAPAGVIDEGETPEQAAARELEEETGLTGGRLVRVGQAHTSPGYSTEKLHLFIAVDPRPGRPRPEKHEIIETVVFPLTDLVEMALRGDLEDLKTVALVLAAARILNL